jgi:hypothetical protein
MAKSFPDLNNDGEVTQADILKGRGVYKKGGKVKKKRYEDGGEVEFESKMGQNPGIDDDTRARAKAYVAGTLQDETGKESKIRRNTETGELYSTENSFKPVPKATPITESEAKPVSNKPASPVSSTREKTGFEKKKEAAMSKPDVKPAETKKEAPPTARSMPSRPDREKTGFEKKKEAFLARTDMRAGGKVSSASKRADGIAIRGRTRA